MKSKKLARYLTLAFIVQNAQFARKSYLTYKFHKDFIPMLDILAKYGFIRSYDIKESAKLLIIWLKGARNVLGIWQPSFIELHRLPHYRRNPTSVSYGYLQRLSRHEGGAALYILNTDRGILTHLDALKLSIGGKILFRIA